MRDFSDYNVDTHGRRAGVVKTFCELCRPTRRDKRDRSLRVNIETGHCHCYHCGADFYVPDKAEESRKAEERAQRRKAAVPQHFRRPVFDAARTTLSEPVERWLVQTRCIPQDVIAALRITEQEEFMPQSGTKERCVCFNYFEDGELVNTKYRSMSKHFKMEQGAELIPYNIDSVLDQPTCVVTEGELDAASVMAAGWKPVVSVPAGANANLTWLDRFVETHFEKKKCIYLAVDTDVAGLKLREELLRRFGPERCRVVTYGEGCKDANEHLLKYGAESLRIALERAEEVPLEGVFTATDLLSDFRALYENGFGSGAETGWEAMDGLCTYELGRSVYVTGVPGSGKSEWIDELVLRLCLRHQWKIAFFSPENTPITYHLRKLTEKLTARSFKPLFGMTDKLFDQAASFLSENVCHLALKDDPTPEAVLAKCREVVARKGCRIFVLDPLNRFEHNPRPGQTETQYLSSFLNKLTKFAMEKQSLVILVAHPRKMNRNPMTGKSLRPELYDISGSADFNNKADYGIVVERDDEVGVTRIHVDKVRFKPMGHPGVATFVYDVTSGRFLPCRELEGKELPAAERVTDTKFDSSCWLEGQGGEQLRLEMGE